MCVGGQGGGTSVYEGLPFKVKARTHKAFFNSGPTTEAYLSSKRVSNMMFKDRNKVTNFPPHENML